MLNKTALALVAMDVTGKPILPSHTRPALYTCRICHLILGYRVMVATSLGALSVAHNHHRPEKQ